jgi:hypothetical protein
MPLPLPSLAAARGARAAVARDAICAPPTAGIEVASVAVLVGLIIADERSPYTRRRSVCSRGAPDGVKGQIVAFCSTAASVRPTFGRLQLFSRSASLDPRYLRASGPLISDTSGAGEDSRRVEHRRRAFARRLRTFVVHPARNGDARNRAKGGTHGGDQGAPERAARLVKATKKCTPAPPAGSSRPRGPCAASAGRARAR